MDSTQQLSEAIDIAKTSVSAGKELTEIVCNMKKVIDRQQRILELVQKRYPHLDYDDENDCLLDPSSRRFCKINLHEVVAVAQSGKKIGAGEDPIDAIHNIANQIKCEDTFGPLLKQCAKKKLKEGETPLTGRDQYLLAKFGHYKVGLLNDILNKIGDKYGLDKCTSKPCKKFGTAKLGKIKKVLYWEDYGREVIGIAPAASPSLLRPPPSWDEDKHFNLFKQFDEVRVESGEIGELMFREMWQIEYED